MNNGSVEYFHTLHNMTMGGYLIRYHVKEHFRELPLLL